MDDQRQADHDRDVEIAHNEAKREFFSDFRLSTWAISLATVSGLALLAIYLMRN